MKKTPVPEEIEQLIENLMQATFHMDDETAEPIVDSFIEAHPNLLLYFTKKYLYSI